ncbi:MULTISPECIES: glycosyltransferase [Acinetobacter]|uniref:glycosyltransferase n=1 Tax=Acinetobacter TaxID=469 RepID=UPI00062920D3|nr:glycosyltransferase [Acinetobacter sp. AG1]KKW78457.1 hypothetical protein AAV96_10710 [Acinetobacter sp. AG1]
MKILHCAIMLSYSSGIYQQMCWEKKAANMLGKDLTVKIFCPQNTYPNHEVVFPSRMSKSTGFIKKAYAWFKIRKEFYNWLLNESLNYDIILLRYSVHDPFLLAFLHKVLIPTYLVHHTLELPELNSLGVLGKCRGQADSLLGRACISRAAGIIGVTQEIVEFEQTRIIKKKEKTLVYPNGVFLESKLFNDNRSDIPEILFVASYFFEWHGLDLLLVNLKNTDEKFILHVVGNVEQADKELAINDNRVIFHGQLTTKEINDLAQKCWVGLSSFALYRKGMHEACTLKVREYLSLGLPVYSGHRDIFPEDFSYYKNGAPDFDSILEFSKDVRVSSREHVFNCSESFINKVNLVDDLINQLERLNYSCESHD